MLWLLPLYFQIKSVVLGLANGLIKKPIEHGRLAMTVEAKRGTQFPCWDERPLFQRLQLLVCTIELTHEAFPRGCHPIVEGKVRECVTVHRNAGGQEHEPAVKFRVGSKNGPRAKGVMCGK